MAPVEIQFQRQLYLSYVRHPLRVARLGLGRSQAGQDDARQKSDDGDDDQKLYESESAGR